MSLYRKKPVVIEARLLPLRPRGMLMAEWPTNEARSVMDWCGARRDDLGAFIPTLEGDMLARAGDWIIQGVRGEFYPCKPEIFEATYEPAETQRSSHADG